MASLRHAWITRFFTGCEVPRNVEIEINYSQSLVDVLVSSIM